jgi:hypothetical protein
MTAAALPSVPPSPATHLADLIDGLCKAVAAHGPRGLLTVPLLLLLWSRLRRMAGRARRLAARLAAGAPLSIPRGRRAPRSAPSRPYLRLPNGLTWLVRAVPGTASGAATLQFLLADPEMAALAEAPPMRRLLRPLCRMLGVQAPPVPKRPVAFHAVAPPPPARPPRPSPPDALPSGPSGARDQTSETIAPPVAA